jgi:hypothetical protein
MAQRAFFLQRLNDHVQYLKKIQATLEGAGQFKGTDYHECKLGKWLYGEGRDEADAIGAEARALFDNLFGPHQRFHELSAEAVEKAQSGDPEASNAASTEMHRLSTELVNKLLELDRLAT